MAEVSFDSLGFAYVRVYIKPKDTPTMRYASYKVDSGANRTTVSHKELLRLGYDEEWIKSGKLLTGDDRPTLASGEPVNDCYQVVLPEINIGGHVGYNWPFLTGLSVSFRFLLGTDTMRYFDWVFDYKNGICRYELITDKRQSSFNQPGQSIHSLDEIRGI